METSPEAKEQVPPNDWEKMMEAHLDMQREIIASQQRMISELAVQNQRTNASLRELTTQVKILQLHIVEGKPRSTDETKRLEAKAMTKQLATLQASLLWTQRNVRSMKMNLKKSKANSRTTLDRAEKRAKLAVTERLASLHSSIEQLEDKACRKANEINSKKIREQNTAVNEMLRVEDPLKKDVKFVMVPRVCSSKLSPRPGRAHKRNQYRLTTKDNRQGGLEGKEDKRANLGLDVDKTTLAEAHMRKRIDSWTTKEKLKIMCATWNCNARKPSEDLERWLSSLEQSQPHIIAIGLQEVVELSVKHVFLDLERRMKPWMEAINLALNRDEDNTYSVIISKQMVGLMLFIYVRQDIQGFISSKEATAIGCGKAGAGNKGAVVARFQYYNTTLCFVNAHLAAHKEHVEQRNNDYKRIMEKVRFPAKAQCKAQRIDQHEALFWFGDLNYRLNFSSEDLGFVYQLIDRRDWQTLLRQDQLLAERRKQGAFNFFLEGDIDFAPTFKYTPETNQYARGDGKNRMPAWCDRVLWRAQNHLEVKQIFYRREDSLMASDHKPVAAYFDITLRVIDPDKQATVYEQINSKIMHSSNEAVTSL